MRSVSAIAHNAIVENLTIEEAAYRLAVSVATARRWAASGKIAATKSGKQWIVDGAQLSGRRIRSRRSGQTSIDPDAALRHVRRTDLAELPVPDILRYADELDNEDALLAVAQKKLDGSRPDPSTEIHVDKTSVFTRRMVGLRLCDRVAWQAAIESFADRVEARTSPAVFSARLSDDDQYFFRRGSTQWSRWREAALGDLGTGEKWLVTSDLTAYFDTIRHRQLVADIESLNVDPSIVLAVRQMLREWGISDGVGLPQGPNASRLLGNLFLLPVDDAMLEADWKYSRYLDDVLIITTSRSDAVKAVRRFQHECEVRGLIVGSSKTQLLHGEDAIKRLSGSQQLATVDYLFQAQASNLARRELKKVLKQALRSKPNIDTRKARFSLWRLAKLREAGVVGQVLNRLEDLGPVASVVAAYLQPFITRKKVVDGIANFLADPSRSYSPFLCAWLFALMLEHPGRQPKQWSEQAMARVKDRNQPEYLRAVAATVVGKGARTGDVSWIKREVAREHDPTVLRGFTVALFWADALDRSTQTDLVNRNSELRQTISYLRGRTRLPSLVFTDRWLAVDRETSRS